MVTKTTAEHDTKVVLLDAGMHLMLQKGYSNLGINEILQVTKVPKGSFYHHFDSKESFAVAMINHFDSHYAAEVFATLSNMSRTPLERLRDYCESSKSVMAKHGCRHGCLIGNLSQEMSSQSETLRRELFKVMSHWRQMFADCIEEGQRIGEITDERSAYDLAEFFYASWNGAITLAKTTKSTEPLDIFFEMMFEDVLRPNSIAQ
jgi:TetR/AcrR family transcriptional regulator, transcriptional repressor for nem operon